MRTLFVALAIFALAFASQQHDIFHKAIMQSVKDSQANGGKTWVVLIAGSAGWSNYRHQSSVYKAYQLAHESGIPDERIITFFEDDIADSPSNPFPGKVFNELYVEGGKNVNVYEGVVKDYTHRDASVKNLINALSGVPTTGGSGKILESTDKDNVFIFYDDHGNSGIIGMPTEEIFYDHDLTNVLNAMTRKKMFKNLIFFMSACYSGSMWFKQDIPANVYVATSAPTSASSYACLEDPKLRTFVTSCWPHGWISSINQKGLDTDFGTIFEDSYNYASTYSETSPCQYGDLSLKNMTFLGFMKNKKVDAAKESDFVSSKDKTAVPQYLVPYRLAKSNYEREPSEQNYATFKAESEVVLRVDRMVSEIVHQSLPNDFLDMSVCKVCDESCDCYASCMKTGTSSHCSRMCCDYAACTSDKNQNSDEIDCALTLQRAFTDAVEPSLRMHPYILSAGPQWNRLCRSGVDVTKALLAINNVCH